MLVVNAGILLGLGAASFSILFAVASSRPDEFGCSTISRGMAIPRLVSSLSWTVGPALGAVLVVSDRFSRRIPGSGLASWTVAGHRFLHPRERSSIAEGR